MLILIYLLSVILGLVATYYVIKLAVKHAVQEVNQTKPSTDNDSTNQEISEEMEKRKKLMNDIIVVAIALLVLTTLFLSGAFE